MNFPLDVLQMIKNGANPQQLIMNFLETQMRNTPIGENLLNMAKNNNQNDIEAFARNYCKSRGADFDKEFNSFKQSLGIK